MSIFNGNSFLDRQTAAAKARKAQAERFLAKTKYDPNDPAIIEREAKRRAIGEAREVRAAQRQALKEAAEAERLVKVEAERLAQEEALRLEAIPRENAPGAKRPPRATLPAPRQPQGRP